MLSDLSNPSYIEYDGDGLTMTINRKSLSNQHGTFSKHKTKKKKIKHYKVLKLSKKKIKSQNTSRMILIKPFTSSPRLTKGILSSQLARM